VDHDKKVWTCEELLPGGSAPAEKVESVSSASARGNDWYQAASNGHQQRHDQGHDGDHQRSPWPSSSLPRYSENHSGETTSGLRKDAPMFRPRAHTGTQKCADSGENCTSSRCCRHSGSKCYRKDEYWASCNATCSPRRRWDEDAWAWVDHDKKVWTCEELLPGGSAPAEKVESVSSASARPVGADVLVYPLK
jgi:hypothetical protein